MLMSHTNCFKWGGGARSALNRFEHAKPVQSCLKLLASLLTMKKQWIQIAQLQQAIKSKGVCRTWSELRHGLDTERPGSARYLSSPAQRRPRRRGGTSHVSVGQGFRPRRTRRVGVVGSGTISGECGSRGTRRRPRLRSYRRSGTGKSKTIYGLARAYGQRHFQGPRGPGPAMHGWRCSPTLFHATVIRHSLSVVYRSVPRPALRPLALPISISVSINTPNGPPETTVSAYGKGLIQATRRPR
jgi:hypothetical protein